MLTMDASAFRALQIFQTERHPSMHGIGISREGFSLFSLLANTSSQIGTRMFRFNIFSLFILIKQFNRQWFRRPVCDRLFLENRLDTVQFFATQLEFKSFRFSFFYINIILGLILLLS